jgi:hypothetical protein
MDKPVMYLWHTGNATWEYPRKHMPEQSPQRQSDALPHERHERNFKGTSTLTKHLLVAAPGISTSQTGDTIKHMVPHCMNPLPCEHHLCSLSVWCAFLPRAKSHGAKKITNTGHTRRGQEKQRLRKKQKRNTGGSKAKLTLTYTKMRRRCRL